MRTTLCYVKGCFSEVRFSDEEYERLKTTGETFHCLAGHAQHFIVEKKVNEEVAALKREVQRAEAGEVNAYELVDRISDQRSLLIDVVRACPLCGTTPGRAVRIYGAGSMERFEDSLANLRAWMVEHLENNHTVSHLRLPERTS